MNTTNQLRDELLTQAREVRLTDEQLLAAMPECHGSSLGKTWLLSAGRAIEAAVLKANGLAAKGE